MVVTPLYAGLLALLFLVLSWRVIQFRQRGISLGDGGDPRMLRLIRGHANFAEYVPLILLMMGFLEPASIVGVEFTSVTIVTSSRLSRLTSPPSPQWESSC